MVTSGAPPKPTALARAARAGTVASGGGSAAAKTAGAARSGVSVHAAPADRRDRRSRDEINVIGCTVEEATRRVDKFIDNAALAGKPQVRVIHGHGTGALRRGLGGISFGASAGRERSCRSAGTRRHGGDGESSLTTGNARLMRARS